MDTMSLRFRGKPTHPFLMRILMPITRLCLAASFANRDARTVLGLNGHRLKRLLEHTHLSQFVVWCIVKDHHNFMGAGGQSIVVRSAKNPGYIEKYNYTLAGADPSVLHVALTHSKDDYTAMRQQFKSLVHPTTFSIAALPLRWPFSKLTTFYSSQPLLDNFADVFTADGTPRTELYTPTVRKELKLLTEKARLWASKNRWIDLIGPNNVVITPDLGEPHARVIDIGPYAAEYMSDVNPILGESYHAVFMKRLHALERSLLVMMAIVLGTLGFNELAASRSHLPLVKAVYNTLDAVEDRLFD